MATPDRTTTRVLGRGVVPLLVAAALLISHLLSAPGPADAQPAAPTQLPDLVPLPLDGLRVGLADDGSGRALRFHTVTANRGEWPLELHGENVDQSSRTSTAAQCIRWTAPRDCLETNAVGTLTLHPDHGHTHFDQFALLELRSLTSEGAVDESPEALLAPTEKASFCLVDSVRDGPVPQEEFAFRSYGSCGDDLDLVYGISPGWRDVYDSTLEGQQILIDAVPDGDYALRVTVDHEDRFAESDDDNNTTTTVVRLSEDGTRATHLRRIIGERGDDSPQAVAAALCRQAQPSFNGAARVVLARHDVFADALAGAPLAGTFGCVLYTTGGPDAPLDAITMAEIRRALRPGDTVHILGGEQAVSAAAEATLVAAGYTVDRIAGANRYDTAAQVAARVRRAHPEGRLTMLANAGTYADAVTGGAYGAFAGIPIVLTDADALHPTTAAALTALGTTETVVLGGTAAVSDAAADAVPNPLRVAGANRMATAAALATDLWGSDVASRDVILANIEAQDGWTAALAAAPLSARAETPLLGASATRLPAETSAMLTAWPVDVRSVTVLGSGASIGHAVHLAAADAAV